MAWAPLPQLLMIVVEADVKRIAVVYLYIFYVICMYIRIKHVFSCINIRQVPWEVVKTEAEGRGFQHLPRNLANVNALKNHIRSLLLHKP